MFKNKNIKRLTYGLAIGLVVAIFSSALSLVNPFETLQLKTSNLLFTKDDPSTDIVIIAIDTKSLENQDKGGLGKFYEWRRTFYAEVIKNLEEANAKVIGIDVVFSEPSRNIPQEEIDIVFDQSVSIGEEAFINGIAKLATKYVPIKENPDDVIFGEILKDYDSIVLAAKSKIKNFNIKQTDLPYKLFFTEDFSNTGFIDANPAPDQTIREIPLRVKDADGNSYDSFALKIAQKYADIDVNKIPTRNGDLIINYQSEPFSYNHIPFVNALKNEFNPADVKGKIALIGITDSKLGDQHPTPKSTTRFMPGIEIHANAIQTILDQKFLTNQSKTSQIITIFTLSVLGTLALIFLNIWLGIALIIVLFVAYYGAAHAAYSNGIIINMVYPYIAILLIYISSVVYKYFAEVKKRKQVQEAFGKYLSPSVLKEVLKNPRLLHRSGAKKEVTVFFSDIAGFTTVSEQLDPHTLIDLLNDYLGTMTDIIFKHEGTLDKYVGDAIVAYFGAPVHQDDHAIRACHAALGMRAALPKLHEKWQAEGKPTIDFRIGINTGEAIIGNIGAENYFDYTVMGDEVNLGSRLEGANKTYSTNVMISESTYDKIKDFFEVRPLDLIKVKGKNKAVRVFELLAHKGRLSETGGKLLEAYNKGMDLYLQRKFAEAHEMFKQALLIHKDDGPSKLYLQRCEILRDFPPSADWDGVFSMKSK